MSTRDKIVQASLMLFNKQGERAVTTNHIAAHLGMSPGNLYYHFRNKEAIIQAIFDLYLEFISHIIEPPSATASAERVLSEYCAQVFDSIWKFRFFHASMPDILTRDDALHQRYLETHAQLGHRAQAALQGLRAEDLVRISDTEIANLVELMLLVSGFWVSYSMAHSVKRQITRTQVQGGVVKLISLIMPYATESGRPLFLQLAKQYQTD